MVLNKGLLNRLLEETLKNERERFGLDPDFVQVIDQEEEIEALLPVLEDDEYVMNDLAWYIINPKGLFARVQNT